MQSWLNVVIFGVIIILQIVRIKGQSFATIHQQFELDGNTEVVGSTTSNGYPKDWSYFVTSNNVLSNSWTSGIVTDTSATTFESSGKDTKDISLWQWGPDNNEQDKTNILHVMGYAQKYVNDLIIYFGADRYGGSGITANSAFGFWFVQDPLFSIDTSQSTGYFKGNHFPGDILITADFSNPPGIVISTWSGFGTDGSLITYPGFNQQCDSNSYQTICAIYNNVSSNTSLDYPNKIYSETTFMEGGINVGAWLKNGTNLTSNTFPCFSKILSMTRSSTSTSSTLKDFGFGNFELCNTDIINVCNEQSVQIITLNNGSVYFNFSYTIKINQSGVGDIYDVQINIPNGFNDLGSNAILFVDEVYTNIPKLLTYWFIRSNSNVVIPDIIISYCLFDNCPLNARRNITVSNITCAKPTSAPTRLPTRLPTFVPTYSPTLNPTKLPTSIPSLNPTLLPTASPVTAKIFLNVSCNISIDDNFCIDFTWKYTVCNEGDRNINNIIITSDKDVNYQNTISTLTMNQCITSNNNNFYPTRYSINDPVLNNFQWTDTIHVSGSMIIRGNQNISVSASSSFICNICA